jgi:hypothetical protein
MHLMVQYFHMYCCLMGRNVQNFYAMAFLLCNSCQYFSYRMHYSFLCI